MSEREKSGGAERAPGQHAGTVATENPGQGAPGERHEVGSASSSRQHRPHLTENDADAPVEEGREGQAASALPTNASGRDKISAEEQDLGIDEESAYDRRPTQDKDTPPSSL